VCFFFFFFLGCTHTKPPPYPSGSLHVCSFVGVGLMLGRRKGKSVHEHKIYCTWMQEGRGLIDHKKDEFIGVRTWQLFFQTTC
jgi:hypothetical protein